MSDLLTDRPDCGDNSCLFSGSKGGMRTNGGCRCLQDLPRATQHFIARMYRDHERLERELATAKADITDMKNRLEKATTERDMARYEKEIAEWAVVGVASSRVTFNLSCPDEIHGNTDMANILADNAAASLLRGARLAFEAHTDMYAMRQHIHYLENHVASRGVAFKPWVDSDRTREAFTLTRFGSHPYPKAFSNRSSKTEEQL